MRTHGRMLWATKFALLLRPSIPTIAIRSSLHPVAAFSSISMFDRAKERELLTNLLCNNHPELLVITGPRDTGKTRLIQDVKKLTEEQNRLCWVHMNMREPFHIWTNVEAAYRSLLQTFTFNFSRRTKIAAMSFLRALQLNIPLSEGASPSSISWRLSEAEHCHPSDISAFVEMLSAAEKVMNGMRQSVWSGQYFPILSFDDAEKMYTYLDNDKYPEGKMVLEIMREFMIKNTKEQRNFHVVVTATSSVHVRQFLSEREIDGRAEVIVIGDLSRDDAQQFWEEYLPKTYPSIPSPPLSFEDVFAVLGGHMYHLEQCYFRGIPPQLTSIVKMALVSWKQFLVPTSGSKKWKWSRNASLEIMKELYNEGSIQYSAMRDNPMIGEEAIDEMIKSHFLVFQPLPAVVNTGTEDSTRYPILNAPTPAHLWTLRKYFKVLCEL